MTYSWLKTNVTTSQVPSTGIGKAFPVIVQIIMILMMFLITIIIGNLITGLTVNNLRWTLLTLLIQHFHLSNISIKSALIVLPTSQKLNFIFDISCPIFDIQILCSQLYKQSDIYKLGKTVQEIISVEKTVSRQRVIKDLEDD